MKKLFMLFAFSLSLMSMKVEAPAIKYVYICTGPNAKVYHYRSNCRGLNKCSGNIKKITLEDVKNKRRPCKICVK